MAKAPTPGKTRDDKTIRITVRGVAAVVRPADFGPRDDALVRRETLKALGWKGSLMAALTQLDEESIGLDSICLLWWLSRRKAGDTTEAYAQALDGFPNFAEAAEQVQFEEVLDGDGDGEGVGSPEA